MKHSRVFLATGTLLALLLGVGLLYEGCSKSKTSNPTPEPVCQINPASLSFDSVTVGESKEMEFTIKNAGDGVLSGSVAENCDAYGIRSGGGGFNLAADETLRVKVAFAPSSTGTQSCNISTGTERCGNMSCTGIGRAVATGACCASTGTCAVTVAAACVAPDIWQGAHSACAPNPCPQPTGACCTPSGVCALTTQASCASPNHWQGPSTVCVPNPCPPPAGACCTLLGTCSVTTQVNCTGTSSWLGSGSVCTPNPCPPPSGACCATSGACTVSLQENCASPSSWLGASTSCVPNNCPQPTGACCTLAGTCSQMTLSACDYPNAWLGAGTACTPNPCDQPRGACCRTDGSCAVTRETDCSGAWQGPSILCSPNPCPAPTGACCSLTAVCTLTQQAECPAEQSWQGAGTTCSPNLCPLPTGACCALDGTCVPGRLQGQCTGTNTWQGPATVCSPNPCQQPSGACCHHDGTCASATQVLCVAPNSWLGGGTSCSPNICPQPQGACCNLTTGACSSTAQAACASPSVWQGIDTVCSPNPCPQPQGACCAPDGSCNFLTQAACVSPHTWLGAATVCSPNPCPQPQGACCALNGGCTLLTQADCTTPAVWKGANTACTPNPCPHCALSLSTINFGAIPVGASKDTTVTLSNTGGPVLEGTIAEACDHYAIIAGGGAFSVSAGNVQTFTIRFTPASAGSHSCSIETGVAACGTIACTGSGLAAPTGMVYVAADTLRMGETGVTNAPPNDVKLTSFYMDKYEVTTAEYKAFIDAGGYTDSVLWSAKGWQWLKDEAALGDTIRAPQGWKGTFSALYLHNDPSLYPDDPVVGVSWWEADAYARYRGKRLPTEAEWELAARGGCRRLGNLQRCDDADRPDYPWGNSITGAQANYGDSGDPYEADGGSTPVGFYDGHTHGGFATIDSPSPYGLYDTVGNVWEWCHSAFVPYPYDATDGRELPPVAPGTCCRVIRGGSWQTPAGAEDLKTSYRIGAVPTDRTPSRGFRCASNP